MICIACRFCLGFCPVWKRLDEVFFVEKKESLESKDFQQFAYLCHDCRDCHYACPYKPLHELNLNIPKLNTELRESVDAQYIRPKFMSRIQKRQYSFSFSLFIVFFAALVVIEDIRSGSVFDFSNFSSIYRLISVRLLEAGGIILGSWGIGILTFQSLGYWKGIGGSVKGLYNLRAHKMAIRDTVLHRWFRGGGEGCSYPGQYGSYTRFYFHAFIFLGVAIDFISTLAAAYLQDIARIGPPYSLTSFPVISGIAGGILLIFGTIGLLYTRAVSDKALSTKFSDTSGYLVIILLAMVTFSGFVVFLARNSHIEGVSFTFHLSLITVLFVVIPYTKLTHVFYRYLALVKSYL